MSSTQKKRNSYEYRKHYLEHNPGIPGLLTGNRYYVCAYCFKIITKKEMEVDHAVPLKIPILGVNRVINCVPSCRECNRKKSYKTGIITIRGLMFKVFEEVFLSARKVVKYSLKQALKIIFFPITASKKFLHKLMFIGVYLFIAWFIIFS